VKPPPGGSSARNNFIVEAGFERTYQGTTLMAHWPIDLEPGAAWKVKLQFELIKSAQ
jgi:hypothetical protein